jgi:peptidoglycan LD-endopeptidase LytH
MLTKTAHVWHRAEPWIRRGAALALFVVMGGALAQAAEIGTDAGAISLPLLIPIAPTLVAPAQQLEPVVVWDGADIDGDGTEDFVNPTGGDMRGHDAYGSGQFGASRDGGDRHHVGVDYVAQAGQEVKAPISGYVSRIGYPYDDDSRLRYVEITNPALNYTARAFYVSPSVNVGDAVQLGDVIGKAASLQTRYSGITDHVHLEVLRKGRHIDATTLITARVETRVLAQAATPAADEASVQVGG